MPASLAFVVKEYYFFEENKNLIPVTTWIIYFLLILFSDKSEASFYRGINSTFTIQL
jgi:hypothetical protein